MKNFIGILLFFIMLSIYGQRIIETANIAFQKKEFVDAIKLYKQALSKTKKLSLQHEILLHIGDSYLQLHDYDNALQNYELCYRKNYVEPEIYFQMGKVLLIKGEYDDAKEYLNIYLETHPEDKQVKNMVKSCLYAIKTRNQIPDLVINNEKKLNTPYDEYGLVVVNQSLMFSSSRIENDSTGTYSVTGQAYNDFYETKYDVDKGMWEIPAKIYGQINLPYNEGTCTYNEYTNTLYFMVCNGLTGKKNNCNIYFSVLDKLNNLWTEPQILPIRNNEYNYGHPAVTSDGKVLYFVSDMPGGEGGKDIWRIQKNENDTWTEPENMGRKINTIGDELFPYVYKDSLLYFSSDGHIGYGGLDIFYSTITKRIPSKPKNAMLPINSSADDFGIIIFKPDSGLFCSNRPGGKGNDDIYSFHMKQEQFMIKGYVLDSKNNEPIVNALILLNSDKADSDSTHTNDEGAYRFDNVKTGHEYALTVYKKGYLRELQFIEPKSSTHINKKDTIVEMKFDMIHLTNEEIRISEIYYDFGKWNLTEESRKELDKLVNIMKINPDIKIRINSHTDDIGGKEFNQELSNYRAQSVVNTLIEKGVNPDRLSYRGWGEIQPFYVNAKTDEERKLNRRTTFQIVNLDDIDLRYSPAKYEEIAETIIINRKNEKGYVDDFEEERKEVVFRLQVYAGKRKISRSYQNQLEPFLGRYRIIYSKDREGMYRYAIGDFKRFDQAIAFQEILSDNNYDSFVTAFMNGLRITILEARQMSERYTKY